MANNKNANEKQPGENEPGKFHYNPGNMSGKKIGTNESPQRHETKSSRAQRSKALTKGRFAEQLQERGTHTLACRTSIPDYEAPDSARTHPMR